MQTINWDESLTLGVAEMDDDHRELVRLGNELIKTCDVDVNPDVFFQALNELVTNATRHFCREEVLMESASYFDLVRHRAEHNSLLDALHELRFRLASERNRELNIDSLSFVRSWLIDHIVGFDRMFAEWVQLQGIVDRICLDQQPITKVSGIAA